MIEVLVFLKLSGKNTHACHSHSSQSPEARSDDEPPEACSDVGTHVLTRVLVFLELSGKNTQSCHSSQ